MDIPRRCFLTIQNQNVTAEDNMENAKIGGYLDTAYYNEEMSFTELIAFFQQQIIQLKKQNISFILANNCPSLHIARAIVFACRKENLCLAICMSCNEDGETPCGDNITACLIALQELGISAFGIGGNLTPSEITDVLDNLSPFAKISLMAIPAAGDPNPIIPELYDLAPQKMAEAVLPLLDKGVSILGQGNGVTDQHITALKETLFSYDNTHSRLEHEDEEDHFILSNARHFFVIHDERLEITEPFICSHDMADALLDAEDDSYDVLLIRIETADDAMIFADNAHLAALPVMFSSDNDLALKAALMLYNGRAMIDSESAIEEAELKEIAAKYGSVLY